MAVTRPAARLARKPSVMGSIRIPNLSIVQVPRLLSDIGVVQAFPGPDCKAKFVPGEEACEVRAA
jgi:hypothetical protein